MDKTARAKNKQVQLLIYNLTMEKWNKEIFNTFDKWNIKCIFIKWSKIYFQKKLKLHKVWIKWLWENVEAVILESYVRWAMKSCRKIQMVQSQEIRFLVVEKLELQPKNLLQYKEKE